MNLSNRDFTELCICSFRYALERKTGVSWDISRLLIREIEHIDDWARKQMARDILHKLESGCFDDFDRENWTKLLNKLDK